jgi:hypothetical protein
MVVAEPLLDAWMHSGELNQLLGVLADKSYRGHYVANEDLEKIRDHVNAAQQLTARCLTRDKTNLQCGEDSSRGKDQPL